MKAVIVSESVGDGGTSWSGCPPRPPTLRSPVSVVIDLTSPELAAVAAASPPVKEILVPKPRCKEELLTF